MDTLTGRFGFTVIVTVLEVAGLPVLQARFDVMITYTWSPFTGIQEYVTPVPAEAPFLNHWYDGVPPFTGVAVKVADAPAQTGLAEGTTETLTGSKGLVVTVTVLVGSGPPQVPVAF